MTGLALFGETVDGRWRPGIGDPTVLGWVTVVAYLVAALLCLRAARRESRRGGSSVFWLGLTALLVALGVNKQLDLQTLATEIGRDTLKAWGEHENRRRYQVVFIGAVAAACVGGFATFLWVARRDLRRRWVAVAGVFFLLGFVVVRAASFHHVDVLLASTIGGVRWNGVFELGGIGLIGTGAARVRTAARAVTA